MSEYRWRRLLTFLILGVMAMTVTLPVAAEQDRKGKQKDENLERMRGQALLLDKFNLTVKDPATGKIYHIHVDLRKGVDVRVNGVRLPRLLRHALSTDLDGAVLSDVRLRYSEYLVSSLDINLISCFGEYSYVRKGSDIISNCEMYGDITISYYPDNQSFSADILRGDMMTIYRCPEFSPCR